MEKYFNTTGVCIPRKHYMVNIDNKLLSIEKLINRDSYFTINKPRQFGKTTTLALLKNRLKEKYIVISCSFEGLGDFIFSSEKEFSNIFIDEVDKSSNNQLFLSFLGMLRNKYLSREMDEDFTFKSVILAGVHDVKTLKLKFRDDEEVKLNSPWNIAVNFKYDYFSSKIENTSSDITSYNFRNNFLLSNGGLDMNKVLLKFQQFMKEQYSTKDEIINLKFKELFTVYL